MAKGRKGMQTESLGESEVRSGKIFRIVDYSRKFHIAGSSLEK